MKYSPNSGNFVDFWCSHSLIAVPYQDTKMLNFDNNWD